MGKRSHREHGPERQDPVQRYLFLLEQLRDAQARLQGGAEQDAERIAALREQLSSLTDDQLQAAQQQLQGERLQEDREDTALVTTLTEKLDTLKEVVVKRMSKVLVSCLTVADSSGNGETPQVVGFAYSVDGDQGRGSDTEAEYLAHLTDLQEADPDLARMVISAIAQRQADAARAATEEADLAPETGKPSKAASEHEQEARHATAQHALTLAGQANAERALVAYLSGRGVSDGDAAWALLTLDEKNPTLSRAVMAALPHDTRKGLVLGRAQIGSESMYTLLNRRDAAELVSLQFKNDRDPHVAFTDEGNMTAAYLLLGILKTHDDPHGILLELGREEVDRIVDFDYAKLRRGNTRGGDPLAAQQAQEELRSAWNWDAHADAIALRKKAIKQEDFAGAARQQEEAAKARVADVPAVDLGQKIDLDRV